MISVKLNDLVYSIMEISMKEYKNYFLYFNGVCYDLGFIKQLSASGDKDKIYMRMTTGDRREYNWNKYQFRQYYLEIEQDRTSELVLLHKEEDRNVILALGYKV